MVVDNILTMTFVFSWADAVLFPSAIFVSHLFLRSLEYSSDLCIKLDSGTAKQAGKERSAEHDRRDVVVAECQVFTPKRMQPLYSSLPRAPQIGMHLHSNRCAQFPEGQPMGGGPAELSPFPQHFYGFTGFLFELARVLEVGIKVRQPQSFTGVQRVMSGVSGHTGCDQPGDVVRLRFEVLFK